MTNQQSVYNLSELTEPVKLSIEFVNKSLYRTLEMTVAAKNEGKCNSNGFVKPGSVKLISHTCGKLDGGDVIFDVLYKCQICVLAPGMMVGCVVTDISTAGIVATSKTEQPSPYTIYIIRDHHYNNAYFNTIEIGDEIMCEIITSRFELNDECVFGIAAPIENSV